MIAIQFHRRWGVYNAGEVAGFDPETATDLIDRKIAQPLVGRPTVGEPNGPGPVIAEDGAEAEQLGTGEYAADAVTLPVEPATEVKLPEGTELHGSVVVPKPVHGRGRRR